MCPDLKVLTQRYDSELRVYAETVRSLEGTSGTTFLEASQRVDRALLAFENARDQVNEHIRSHNCLAGSIAVSRS